MSYKAIYVIVLREFKRFFRQKGRVLVTIARPLLWLLIVGAGFTRIIDPGSQGTYIQFLLPGIVGMTILFSSIFSTISVVWDREFGFLREMLVAPVSRVTIVAGKLLSGTALSLFQGAALLVVAPFLGIKISPGAFLAMIFLIMNFIVLPMFFLSGALYPIQSLPDPIRYLALINPLCYGVDSFKHILFTGGALTTGGIFEAEFPLSLDIIAVSIFIVVMIPFAAKSFERR
jgi:ABC-2 type transport system permease protein